MSNIGPRGGTPKGPVGHGSIRRVTRISTGTVDIHPQHAYGSRAPTYWWILTSSKWLSGLPINVYVIEHRHGLVLFDTGQDRASVTDPDYFPAGPLRIAYRRLARFDIPADQTLSAQLRGIGYDPADVDLAVVSHLHQDHIGGLGELPNARIVVSAAEYRTMASPMAEANGVLRRHLEFPSSRWMPVAFERLGGLEGFERGYDLFGDGSLTVLSTPGHTPGSVSLLVDRPQTNSLLLVGDVTYDAARMLTHGSLPGVGKRTQLADTTQRIRQLHRSRPDLQIMAAHDPATISRL